MSNKFGIYIHIPFCTTICPFCNFNVYKAQTEDYNDLVALLLSELQENYNNYLQISDLTDRTSGFTLNNGIQTVSYTHLTLPTKRIV